MMSVEFTISLAIGALLYLIFRKCQEKLGYFMTLNLLNFKWFKIYFKNKYYENPNHFNKKYFEQFGGWLLIFSFFILFTIISTIYILLI